VRRPRRKPTEKLKRTPKQQQIRRARPSASLRSKLKRHVDLLKRVMIVARRKMRLLEESAFVERNKNRISSTLKICLATSASAKTAKPPQQQMLCRSILRTLPPPLT